MWFFVLANWSLVLVSVIVGAVAVVMLIDISTRATAFVSALLDKRSRPSKSPLPDPSSSPDGQPNLSALGFPPPFLVPPSLRRPLPSPTPAPFQSQSPSPPKLCPICEADGRKIGGFPVEAMFCLQHSVSDQRSYRAWKALGLPGSWGTPTKGVSTTTPTMVTNSTVLMCSDVAAAGLTSIAPQRLSNTDHKPHPNCVLFFGHSGFCLDEMGRKLEASLAPQSKYVFGYRGWYLEANEGHKYWDVTGKTVKEVNLKLLPSNMHYGEWVPGPNQAVCRKYDTAAFPGYNTTHRAGASGCQCGFWCLNRLRDVEQNIGRPFSPWQSGARTSMRIWGSVMGWGQCTRHAMNGRRDGGWRCEYAQIIAFMGTIVQAGDSTIREYLEYLKLLSERFDVPVIPEADLPTFTEATVKAMAGLEDSEPGSD